MIEGMNRQGVAAMWLAETRYFNKTARARRHIKRVAARARRHTRDRQAVREGLRESRFTPNQLYAVTVFDTAYDETEWLTLLVTAPSPEHAERHTNRKLPEFVITTIRHLGAAENRPTALDDDTWFLDPEVDYD